MTAIAGRPASGSHPWGAEAAVLGRQVRHELVALARTPVTLILSIGLPLLFFVLLSALIGNEVIDPTQGVRLVQFLAPGMASFGVVMATFSFLAVGLAEARAAGVVKRQSGTPVPRWVLVGGRVGAALVLGLVSTALVLVTGVALYGLVVRSRSVVAVLVTLLLASATFSALGLALAMALPTMQLTLAVSNGVVIPLAFVSDMFMVGAQMPPVMSTIGWLFPLKHLTALFADALNPYLTGSGFQADHLAVIAIWGLLGAVVATALLRRDEDRARAPVRRAGVARAAGGAATRRHAADAVPRRNGSPSVVALLVDQLRHAQSVLWRDASAVFFAVAFPVVLVAIIPSVNGGGDRPMAGGLTLGVFYAGTMAVYGAAVTAYVNLPQGVAEDRERGVLKRTGGAPLPAAVLVAGRVAGAVGVALVTGAAIAVLTAVAYRPARPAGLAAAVVTLLVATVCFAVLGMAVMTFVRSAQAVIGVTLGTLLPLAFVSDIFVVGAQFPTVLEWVSWLFPLRHASAAMSEALGPTVTGTGLAFGHLGALLAWTVVAAVVLARRFRWEARESGHTARTSSR
ncbi:ABC transporter permease [Terrabacter carboxydivorans]|uniref:Transport permease protein n=1 Tax=Terrabacter carboxydivorans TaxID=619730 RepID=A0ABP5YLH6_9MICO